MDAAVPEPGVILEGDIWPEPVRVLECRKLDGAFMIRAEGRSGRLYSGILRQAELDRLRRISEAAADFKGDAEAFFLAMEARRIRFAHQFDPLYALSVSQVDPLPHQIDAVYHHILRQPRVRFLLADDPGAGKTIMAGLVLKELKYRGLVERTLIIVPGHLRDQWLREMKERFAESFVAVDRAVMNANWGRNIWAEEPQIIASMDFMKQDDVLASIDGTRWDLVIVDEAHKMAAYRFGQRLSKTERYRLGEALSRNSRFLLFLTATPHRGDPENFRLLLDLLEPGLFASTEMLERSVRDRDNPLFLRRLKEDLKTFDGVPLFPPRHVRTVAYRLGEGEMRLYDRLTAYVQDHYNRALQKDQRNVAFAMLILQRRLASSVRAARVSLERRRRRLEELLELGEWLAERGELDEEALEDAPEAERLQLEQELVERLTAAQTREELQHEIYLLGQLIALAKEVERQGTERKLLELRRLMDAEGIWHSGEKLLVFTESRDTLEYLVENLRSWGLSVQPLHGGMDLDERIRAEHVFRDSAQVMVSTEAGGEGINLQFCSLMVNYDIPWNPNRLEQRLGRVHRYGQRKEVHIYNLVAVNTAEGKVLAAVLDKLERIRAAYGSDRVFDVIGEILAGVSLKDLIVDAIAKRRSLDEIIASIERVTDEEAIRRLQEAALVSLATRHIDLRGILGDQERARENRLVPEYVEAFFQRACRFLGIPLERRQDGAWRIERVPYEIRNVPREFKLRYGEVYSEYRRFTFDKAKAQREGAEFVAPGHPLLEAVIEAVLVRTQESARRGAMFFDPGAKLDGLVVFLEGEIRDGTGDVAGRRLFALYQPASGEGDGRLQLISPAVLWDLKPAPGGSEPGGERSPEEGEIAMAALEQALEPYRQELLQERERVASIRSKYGLPSLEVQIAEAEAKLLEYSEREAAGEEIPAPVIANAQRLKEDLEGRRARLLESIRRETSLTPAIPGVCGVARVLPLRVPEDGMQTDQEVEAVAMRVAMEHERREGREVVDVSAENRGYDLRSRAPDGQVRYIEVKGRAGTGSIVLTPNEWLMAQRLGSQYWLYIVENCRSEPCLYMLQDPVSSLKPEEETAVVGYRVRDWKQAALAQMG